MVTNSRMPTSYEGSLDWKYTPVRETLSEPRISSNGSRSGSDGRILINCVILQRRLLRRSVCLARGVGIPPGVFILDMRSNWDAMKGLPFPGEFRFPCGNKSKRPARENL